MATHVKLPARVPNRGGVQDQAKGIGAKSGSGEKKLLHWRQIEGDEVELQHGRSIGTRSIQMTA